MYEKCIDLIIELHELAGKSTKKKVMVPYSEKINHPIFIAKTLCIGQKEVSFEFIWEKIHQRVDELNNFMKNSDKLFEYILVIDEQGLVFEKVK